LKSHLKEFDNQKLTATNEENQKLTELRKDNERKLQELKARAERATIERQQEEIKANTKADVAKVQAEER